MFNIMCYDCIHLINGKCSITEGYKDKSIIILAVMGNCCPWYYRKEL